MAEEKGLKNLIFRRVAGLSVKGEIQKQKNDGPKTNHNQDISVCSPKSRGVHFSILSSNLALIIKKIIPPRISVVNTKKSAHVFKGDKLGTIKIAPKNPEEKFIVNPDNVFNHAFDDFINFNLANDYLFVKQRMRFFF